MTALSSRTRRRLAVRPATAHGYWKSPFEQARRLQVRQRRETQIKGEGKVRIVYPAKPRAASARREERRRKALVPIGAHRGEWKGKRSRGRVA